MVQLEITKICTYWPNNPAFDPKRVPLHRLYFINEERTKYVSVDFYPASDYLPLVEFRVVRGIGGLKIVILSNEQVDATKETFPCYGTPSVVARRLLFFAGDRAVHFG